ncbi:helix-turn-helix domain-containing protein [Paraburkholderia sp. EG286B]|uniref:helix-turn-helix domain-containing protein n=1 Tax=Paraburkholderia sp. EG286B TaxID=3237011 RepID=UPI0034D38A45
MFGMSTRTLARRFVAETGMSLRSWRRRMRLFRGIELLAGVHGVTRVAMELGYSSPRLASSRRSETTSGWRRRQDGIAFTDRIHRLDPRAR